LRISTLSNSGARAQDDLCLRPAPADAERRLQRELAGLKPVRRDPEPLGQHLGPECDDHVPRRDPHLRHQRAEHRPGMGSGETVHQIVDAVGDAVDLVHGRLGNDPDRLPWRARPPAPYLPT
jgi:hypothetical protein